ncbi:MAG: YraN family protein [Acidimicrobiia bacterium]|nr:YraN family protein [Acidimicrobiia bacterium]
MNRRLELGRDGERRAAEWYRARGYTIRDRNWRTRNGELDLIVDRGDEVVFCEVKTRSSAAYGRGVDAVGFRKQRRLRSLALQWLQGQRRRYADVRFDVADVDGDGTVEIIEGCF